MSSWGDWFIVGCGVVMVITGLMILARMVE